MPISKILVVDDSPTERHMMFELLSKNGYHVIMAQNGDDALRRAKEDQPDLILMDVVMPGQNGFQVTRAINREETTKHIPIIICSSKSQETDRIWGQRQGAADYIVKPINSTELLQKIKAFG